MDFQEFLAFQLIPLGEGRGITVAMVLAAIIIFLIAKFAIWIINGKVLTRYFQKKKIDTGRQYALQQFIIYIVWVLAIFGILESLGVASMIWASLAALLIGVGLGLQDVFKDLASGIVLLVEGTVEVGDIVEVDGIVASVKSIGLRTSKVETRDRINILIPNSKLVIDSVINWSHNQEPNRFAVNVGVAYGSDLKIVKQLILKAAENHELVLKNPPPQAQFINFGDSSLDFKLYFFSKEFFRIEAVKSDLRFTIDQHFRDNKVSIPFPQRDLWLRNPESLQKD